MEYKAAIVAEKLTWRYITLTMEHSALILDIPLLRIPMGFSTALIGETGAGKSNLLKTLASINLSYGGEAYFSFGDCRDERTKNHIGYTSINSYFVPGWNLNKLASVNKLLYDTFSKETFYALCEEFALTDRKKPISKYSDGMRTKAALASVFSRDTKVLLLDEPASNLDPIMRDKLCTKMREYIEAGAGERSILFSTHNISDMENVTDYAVIMAGCTIIEQGFVEDLKEKYIIVRGELADSQHIKSYLIDYTDSPYGFEGLCLTQYLDKLTGYDVAYEIPTLTQISMALMKQHSQTR